MYGWICVQTVQPPPGFTSVLPLLNSKPKGGRWPTDYTLEKFLRLDPRNRYIIIVCLAVAAGNDRAVIITYFPGFISARLGPPGLQTFILRQMALIRPDNTLQLDDVMFQACRGFPPDFRTVPSVLISRLEYASSLAFLHTDAYCTHLFISAVASTTPCLYFVYLPICI